MRKIFHIRYEKLLHNYGNKDRNSNISVEQNEQFENRPFLIWGSVYDTEGFSVQEWTDFSMNGWRQVDKHLENIK